MFQAAKRSGAEGSKARLLRTRIVFLLKGIAAALFVLSAGWATVAASAAALLREVRPALVLRLAPADARAKMIQAEQEITFAQDPHMSARAVQLSREALQRDPTLVGAWRTLGLVEAGRGRQVAASRLFGIAQRISRRDAATQLWLIEDNVRRNDVEGALRQYDIALRTSKSMMDVLLPTLVSAAADPAIARPLGEILSTEPPWAYHFYNYLVGGLSSGAAASRLIARLPSEVRLRHLDTLRRLITLSVERQEYDAAWQTYLLLSGASPKELLRNGDFERASAFPVLEWQFTDTPDLHAEQAAAPNARQETALRVSAANGAVGTVAIQLLLLEPGTYRFSTATEMGTPPGPEWLRWQIACEGAGGALLNVEAAPSRPGLRELESTFRVPSSGCRVQWLRLEVAAPDSSSAAEAWVHRVAIRAAREGQRG